MILTQDEFQSLKQINPKLIYKVVGSEENEIIMFEISTEDKLNIFKPSIILAKSNDY